MAKVNIVLVPYKGTGSAIIAVMGGEVQLMFPSPTSVEQHIKSGRLRALAVTSAQPSELVPGLPTVAASGLPGYESESKYGIFAPAKTPAAIVTRLNQELVRVLHSAEVKQRLLSSGVGVIGSTTEEFTDTIKSEMVRLGKVIKDAHIRSD